MSKTYYLKIKQDNGIIRRCRLMTSTGLKVLIVNNDEGLPSTYQEVEWIASDGNQYIDTGVIPTVTLESYAKFLRTSTNGENMIFGASSAEGYANGYNYVVDFYKGGSYGPSFAFGNGLNIATKSSSVNNVYEIEVNKDGNKVVYLDGVQATTAPSSSTLTMPNYSIYLFNRNVAGVADAETAYRFSGRIYYLKFKDNGEYVRNFIPCYRKSDGEIGLYDTVTKTFYTNKGSGTFTMGDVVLPSTYQKVDYIQSSGTQWIDTGFTPNQDTSIELSMNVLSATGTQDFFGASTSADGYSYGFYDDGSAVWDNYNDDKSPYSGHISGEMVVKKTKNVLTVTGSYPMTYTHSTSTFTSGNTMYLFARNKSSGAFRPASIKFYYCKIWDGDSLVRNFIPCLRRLDDTVGLYDTVTGKFYENAGTGVFTNGNVIIPDGYTLASYIQSDGNAYIDTGIHTDDSSSVVTRWEGNAGYLSSSSGRRFIAAYSDPSLAHYCEFNASNYYGVNTGDTTGYITTALSGNTMYKCYLQINGSSSTTLGITINGTEKSATVTTYQASTMGDFVIFRLADSFKGNGVRIGLNKLIIDGKISRYFIPCTRNSDSVIGMYDAYNNVFYKNAGTGSFTKG